MTHNPPQHWVTKKFQISLFCTEKNQLLQRVQTKASNNVNKKKKENFRAEERANIGSEK